MSVADDLRAARAYLVEHGWTQREYRDDLSGAVCMLGACRMAINGALPIRSDLGFDRVIAADLALIRAVGGPVPDFNDHPNRTFDEVLAAFDRAIDMAESREAVLS